MLASAMACTQGNSPRCCAAVRNIRASPKAKLRRREWAASFEKSKRRVRQVRKIPCSPKTNSVENDRSYRSRYQRRRTSQALAIFLSSSATQPCAVPWTSCCVKAYYFKLGIFDRKRCSSVFSVIQAHHGCCSITKLRNREA